MNLIPRDSLFDFDRLFSHLGWPAVSRELETGFFSPKVDIVDQEKQYKIKAELAGVDKDKLSITLEDGVLSIRASMEQETSDEEGGKVIRRERHAGSYMRSFNVGHNISEEDISAKFENGLLELTIPKREEVAQKRKQIEVR